ncbi:lipopolysaccharide biosynthesis protein [Planctomycetota bacterium]
MKRKIYTYIKDSLRDKLFRRIVKNAGWLFTGNIAYALLTACQSVILARMLGLHDFGVLGIMMSIVLVTGSLLSCRETEFLISYFPRFYKQSSNEKAANVLQITYLVSFFSAVVAILLCIIGRNLLINLFIKNDSNVCKALIFWSFSLIFGKLSLVAENFLKVKNSFVKVAIFRSSERFVAVVVFATIFLTRGKIELPSVACILLVASVFRFLLAHYYSLGEFASVHRSWYRVNLSASKEHYREYASFLMHNNINGTLSVVTRKSDELWIGLLVNPTAAGLYKIALSLSSLILMPINQFSQSVFPEIPKLIAEKSIKLLKRNLKRVSCLATLYCVPAIMCFALFGHWLIEGLYGSEFAASINPLLWLLIGVSFASVFSWARLLLLSMGFANISMYINLAMAVLKLILMPILVSRYADVGAAIVLTTLYMFGTGWSLVISRKKLLDYTQERKLNYSGPFGNLSLAEQV